MSNIEEDVKLIDEIIHKKDGSRMSYIDIDNFDDDNICEKFIAAIEHILSEREQDKKRINELEEENHIQRSQIMTVYDNGWIPKQKVKDKMEKLNKEIKNGDEVEAIFKIKQQQILQELLEDK